ncbi:MAG TPA: sigma-70 family RNA polymerase sigma factor [Vicinamibacterales bacterium]
MQTIVDSSDGDLARAVAARGTGETETAEAESELYRRFAPRVRLYGLRHLRDEDAARDLVQQVMLVTIEKLRSGSVRDVDQIASFVLGVSRTMVKDMRRLEWRREKLREAFMVPDVVEAPVGDAMLDVDRLDTCIARLAERERMVVLLTFYAERTAGEVGKELGVKEGNVRVIRHRAVERLRTCMTSREVAQ